jgi:hypothetical protein
MNLKGWPFNPITGIQDENVCGGGDSSGGSPG